MKKKTGLLLEVHGAAELRKMARRHGKKAGLAGAKLDQFVEYVVLRERGMPRAAAKARVTACPK